MDDRFDRSPTGDALLLAAWSGDLVEVGQLLGDAADPNTRDSEGRTALHYAIMHDSKPLAECLLRAGADPDAMIGDDGMPALSYAISERRDEIVDLLLESGASVNPSAGSVTPLMAAVFVEDPLLAQQLLERGADPNAARTVITPLILAMISNQLQCASVLLRGGADVDGANSEGSTPLMYAAETAPLETFHYLLNHGADTERRTKDGMSVLMWAAKGGNRSVLEWLVEQGWSVNAAKEGGYTALMMAAQEDHFETVELLVRFQADVNATASDGTTPLIMAAWRGHVEIVRTLLSAGAKVDYQDNRGRTALMEAALRGHADTVAVLLESGADPDLADNAYWTAPDLAVECEHAECAALLAPKSKRRIGDVAAQHRRRDRPARPDLLRRLALRRTRAEMVHGIEVVVSGSEPSATARVARVREAFDIVAQYDSGRYRILKEHLRRVVVWHLRDGQAVYHRYFDQCEINAGFIDATSTRAEQIALVLVHEATHARLHHESETFTEGDDAHTERICIAEELGFARNLPESEFRTGAIALLEKQLSFPLWYWSPAARLRQSVRAALPRFPRPVARIMWWYARYLESRCAT